MAKVGAPPVREIIELSPTCCASVVSASGVITNPNFWIAAAAVSGVVPKSAAGALIAKYIPGSRMVAQIIAMIPTIDSMSIAP